MTNETLKLQVPVISQHSRLLYFILAIQPTLCLLKLLLGLIQYDSPLDGNFGMIALLAGVRSSTLPLLKGTSISGELSRPLPVTMRTKNIPSVSVEHKGKIRAGTQVEYELGGLEDNEFLPHPWFSKPRSTLLSEVKKFLMRRKRSSGFSSARGWSRAETLQMDFVGTETKYERLQSLSRPR